MNCYVLTRDPLPDPAVAHIIVGEVVTALPPMPWMAARDVAVATMQTGRVDAVVLASAALESAQALTAAAARSREDLPIGVAVALAGVEHP